MATLEVLEARQKELLAKFNKRLLERTAMEHKIRVLEEKLTKKDRTIEKINLRKTGIEQRIEKMKSKGVVV